MKRETGKSQSSNVTLTNSVVAVGSSCDSVEAGVAHRLLPLTTYAGRPTVGKGQ